jgi:hypothetical protein
LNSLVCKKSGCRPSLINLSSVNDFKRVMSSIAKAIANDEYRRSVEVLLLVSRCRSPSDRRPKHSFADYHDVHRHDHM